MSSLIFDARVNSDQLKRDVDRVNRTVRDMTDEVSQEGGKLDGVFRKVGAGIATYFAAGSLSSFAQEIVKVRGEFQKFEAVLTNTLDGDAVKASGLLAGLSEFAAKTPYQLQDITENFVKLANQGIVLTQDELVKLGDFAAVTGKPIGQLFEAIMDINNPERWKEFGSRITTEGEKVAISFRGQRVEFERTIEGAKNAIAQLGTMKGVEGTMAVISKTLNGQISNFQDAWDRMLNELGKANEGTFSGLISGATSLVQNYAKVIDYLKILVATLGAAKAASIVYNIVLHEQAAVTAMVAASNGVYSRSLAYQVLWVERSQKAHALLGKTMLTNPYVLATAAVVALVAGIALLNKRFEESIDAKKKYDERTKQVAATYDAERQKVSALITTLKDASEAESKRAEALRELQNMYPDIFKNLDIHSVKLADLAEKERQATEALAERTLEEQKSFIQTLRARQSALQAMKAEAKSAPVGAYDGSLTPETWDVFKEKELTAASEELTLAVEKYNQMLSDRMNAEKATREDAEKTIQQRIREADSIQKLDTLLKSWQQTLLSATTQKDRDRLQTEINQIEAAMNRMKGVATKPDDRTDAEKIAEDIEAQRKAYEDYYIMVRQMGHEWADEEYKILLQQGKNFEEYLKNRLAAAGTNVTEMLEVVRAADAAGVSFYTAQAQITPISTKPLTSALDSKTLGTKEPNAVLNNMEKWAKWAKTIKDEIKDWDIEDVEQGAQNLSMLFGDMSGQVRDIDEGLSDALGNMSQIFNGIANLVSGNPLQQLAGITGLMTTMYTMGMDSSQEEKRLSRPWEEFEKWISASNRALQQYITLRDNAIGEERYGATDNVIEQTRLDIAEAEDRLEKLKLSFKFSDSGWFNEPWKQILSDAQKKAEEIGATLTLTDEGGFGAGPWSKAWGIFTADISEIVTDATGKFSIDKLNELINNGTITDQKIIEAVDNYNKLLSDLTAAEQAKQELLTATLSSNITDSIVDGFRNGERTIEDFADNFEDLMRNALLNAMKIKMLEPEIAKWTNTFMEYMESAGLDDDETAALRGDWNRIIAASAAYLKGLEDSAGIVTDATNAAQQTGLSGAIKGITEETAGMIAGHMYAIRELQSKNYVRATEQLDAVNQSITHLAKIEGNTTYHSTKLDSIDKRLSEMNGYLRDL